MHLRPCLLALAGLSLTSTPVAVAAAERQFAFIGQGGAAHGTAILEEGPAGVLVRFNLTGLAPGWHAVHFHATGDCSDAEFKASGGHINQEPPRAHGFLNPEGPDFGDLPNLYAGPDGAVHADVFSAMVSFSGEGGRPALMDADGSAIVVHAEADDYKSQPIGGAGDRVACAVVK